MRNRQLACAPWGVLIGLGDDAEARSRLMAFEQGLKTEGWSVGQNLRIEYRYAEGDSARMEAFAKELVELKPDCIVGHSLRKIHVRRNR
jgi:putative ABC transport system substrate-binding protein